MKSLFLISLITIFSSRPGIYTISFSGLNGRTISMADYAGKRIMVIAMDASGISRAELRYLDSLQTARTDMQLIIVPVINALRTTGAKEIQSAMQSIKSGVVVASSSWVHKNAEKNQHPLFQWLTNYKYNLQFDDDAQPGQYFLISPKGSLYAEVLPSNSHLALEKMLAFNFQEPQNYIYNLETKKYDLQ